MDASTTRRGRWDRATVASLALLVVGLAIAAAPWVFDPSGVEVALPSPPVAAPAAPILGPGEVPTFVDHVAPIVHAKCMLCHRPGQVAPFSLITYDDVQGRADTVQAVVLDRYMPPWPPADGGVPLRHARRLSEEQIDVISRWVDAGCPEGERARTPEPPTFAEGWVGGVPDLVVKMSGEFEIPADGPDLYRSFVFPLALDEDRWVRTVELRPAARAELHHANFMLDVTGEARRRDGADGWAGFDWMGLPVAGGLGGYTPGSVADSMPEGLAWFLPKGSDIVMQTHFHPSGKVGLEAAEIGLTFTEHAPERAILPIAVPLAGGRHLGIDVPPGAANYTVIDRYTLPVQVDAVGVGGHAHFICHEMELTATLPDGSMVSLLYIPDWDLNWQGFYFYEEAVPLPAGTVLTSTFIFDNSAANPRNPFDPPRRIRWGRGSTDEMATLLLLSLPEDEAAADVLAAERGRTSVGFVSAQLSDEQRARMLATSRTRPVTRAFPDVSGQTHYPFRERPDTKAVAVAFVRDDCPISNYYQPTLRRLTEEYGERGVAFYVVHADAATTREQARAHAEAYGIVAPVLVDPEQGLVRKLGARVTPEVFVFDVMGTVLYSGRIDDTYTGLGKKRHEPTRHDLRDALDAVLAGRTPEPARTTPVGCFISVKDDVTGEGDDEGDDEEPSVSPD